MPICIAPLLRLCVEFAVRFPVISIPVSCPQCLIVPVYALWWIALQFQIFNTRWQDCTNCKLIKTSHKLWSCSNNSKKENCVNKTHLLPPTLGRLELDLLGSHLNCNAISQNSKYKIHTKSKAKHPFPQLQYWHGYCVLALWELSLNLTCPYILPQKWDPSIQRTGA